MFNLVYLSFLVVSDWTSEINGLAVHEIIKESGRVDACGEDEEHINGCKQRTDAYTLPFGKCPKEPEETDNQPSQGRCRWLGQRPPFKGPAPSPLFTPAMCRKRLRDLLTFRLPVRPLSRKGRRCPAQKGARSLTSARTYPTLPRLQTCHAVK